MFQTFHQKEAVCEIHKTAISFIDIQENQQIGNRALCEYCNLDRPINLKKGQEILNTIDNFIMGEIEERTSDMVKTMSSEIDNIEREFKQLLSKLRKNINEIKRKNIHNPFEKYHNLTVYTTSNYQELAELIKDHYSYQGECILTNELQQSINNSLVDYQSYLLDIKSIRKYISQIYNSNLTSDQFVQIQICEEILLIESHKDTTFQTILEHLELNQENTDIQYYHNNIQIANLNSTLREVGFQQQFPLIMKRLY